MGLLDFKFLILLGLAIVIYFIYKELELHRDRLTFCEEKIKEIKHLTFNENNIPGNLKNIPAIKPGSRFIKN